MDDAAAARFFVWLDRGFWLIWLGFPLLIGAVVRDITQAPDRLARMLPDNPECLAHLLRLVDLSPPGKAVFWTVFGIEFAVYALLLAMAHWVIHRCATGRIFVADMIAMLRRIGMVIALWPVVYLALQNAAAAIYAETGDLPQFEPVLTLDLTVLGVGLLMVTLSLAMRQAVQMREDADLTI